MHQGGECCHVTLMGGGAVAVAGTCPTISWQHCLRALATWRLGATCKCCPSVCALCMDGAVMLKGCARIASRWEVLACDADWRWCGGGCRNLQNNQLAALPESFGNLKGGGCL